MQLTRYTSAKKHEWDELINESKNGTFLFLRDYMDYHSDRFHDHSLMYYNDKGKLIAVLPANESGIDSSSTQGDAGKVLYSHQGLTYGGFVLSKRIHTEEISELFSMTKDYLKTQGFSEWYYKQMPTIYHQLPSEDDEYWLWKAGAKIVDCSLMTAIPIHTDASLMSSSKHNNSNRLMRQGFSIDMDAPISDFWHILTTNLKERFNASPVHTYDEMMLLQSRFPDKIKCCVVKSPDGTTLAGTILYYTHDIVKAQYTSASHEGKHLKVLDMLFTCILDYLRRKTGYHYLDFGTSMLAGTTDLNTGLIEQKEGFGGRGIVCKTLKIEL